MRGAVIIPPPLVDSTIRVATLTAAGSSLTGVASMSVTTLTEGVLKAMLLAKLRYAVLGVATLALVSTGVGVVAQTMPGAPVSTDRLKAVEQKLDRLLEVLGGSRTPAARGRAFSSWADAHGQPWRCCGEYDDHRCAVGDRASHRSRIELVEVVVKFDRIPNVGAWRRRRPGRSPRTQAERTRAPV